MNEIIRSIKERYAVTKGFISTTFLIVMMSVLSLIALKSDYIYSANNVYSNLQTYEDFFIKEAYVINYVKCSLLKEEELHDFVVNDIYVEVYKTKDGYNLCFDDYVISISVYENMIVDVFISKG